jgi:hypothetical protein
MLQRHLVVVVPEPKEMAAVQAVLVALDTGPLLVVALRDIQEMVALREIRT